MLTNAQTTAFIPTRDPQKARHFYQQALGLTFLSEDPFALVFQLPGALLRIANVSTVKDFTPHPFTIFGWRVPDIQTAINELSAKGIQFEQFPGMDQTPDGIWRSPSGAQVAWFKDPDGNLLSLTQH